MQFAVVIELFSTGELLSLLLPTRGLLVELATNPIICLIRYCWICTPNVSGFIAQLISASHRNREVTGSNPVEVLNFSGFSTQL